MTKNPLRLMLVHAHPDDESMGTGGILAKYAAEGIHTVLVTCTMGELGDIQNSEFVPPNPDMSMTDIRKWELETALKILNVGRFYCLGYRDSGMAGTPGNKDPRSFGQADITEASNRLVTIIRKERPHVVVTYDETGIYWHPDHVMAHKITQKAFFDAPDPDTLAESNDPLWQPLKLYHIAIPMSRFRRDNQADKDNRQMERPPSSIVITPEEEITTRIDITPYLDTKFEAIFSHESQISATHRFRNLSSEQKKKMMGFEHFVCAYGCDKHPGDEKEADLFEGLRKKS